MKLRTGFPILLGIMLLTGNVLKAEIFQQDPEVSCPVHAGFSVAQFPLCKSDILQLINASFDALWYEWYLDGVLFSTDKNPSLQLITTGNYHIMLISSNYICSDTAEITLEVNDIFYTQLNEFICHGDTICLHGHHFTQSGVYNITLKTAQGCDSIIALHLFVDSTSAAFTINGGVATASSNYQQYQWYDCDNGFVPVPSANSNIFQPSQSGSYALVASNLLCADTADCQLIIVTGTETPHSTAILKIYPNPVKEHLYVSGLIPGKHYDFSVITAEGRVINNVRLSFDNNFLRLGNLPSGIYYLKLNNATDGSSYWRFLIE